MGGGVGFPDIGQRSGVEALEYEEGKQLKLRRGESGGVWSERARRPLSISRGRGSARAWRVEFTVRDECSVCEGVFA